MSVEFIQLQFKASNDSFKHMELIHSFPPICRTDAKILILGSMPGEASLAAQQYYAHPQNAFWSIIGTLLNFEPNQPYANKIKYLLDARIALWDVLQSCHRQGSLDTRIKNETANDFASFFARHPAIETVFFNGTKAEASFNRHVYSLAPPHLRYIRLPSTSPAHAALRKQDKINVWQCILQPLNN